MSRGQILLLLAALTILAAPVIAQQRLTAGDAGGQVWQQVRKVPTF